ncbi:hypothetical protein PF005_g11632 [Phytophthora fragariae]|uniref:Uncharacterized protein n=1 Tax=Phytophthora fragariae TaxID=53985 RepID=A0A6A4DV16_9STRA|nr:hypothetical protein PF003_g16465 [Phytophthora fragariae]KAE8937276.1 hypothetical protein PF009_g12813 [Phytophthora fragariae]KAE8990018.1 hypothetical protein PF011_g18532 [Phytophthora fragariae]KAE9110727.1 hypothetical protein PF010_g11062 [Phytophthora fragariae]KAE9144220.1 hypothetical protein PF006_g10820 [Phytophthora fragariae]
MAGLSSQLNGKWEPTGGELPSGEVKKYRHRKRCKAKKTYIEAEAEEE